MASPAREQFDVFISHSSDDSDFVKRLREGLEQRNFKVWPNSILPGQLWVEAMLSAITVCNAFVLVISPESMCSHWVREELNVAMARKIPLYPVVRRKVEGELPPSAVIRQQVDFTEEPTFESRLDELCKGLPEPRGNRIEVDKPDSELIDLYGECSRRGENCLLSGEVAASPYLNDLKFDGRRGLTLIVRPTPSVAAALNEVAREMKRAFPALFVYDRTRYHFTILSLVTAHAGFQRETVPADEYARVIRDVCVGTGSFPVRFQGVCATESCVMAKGYPVGPKLEGAREALRERLRAAGLTQEERYRIKGAHVVLARFRELAPEDSDSERRGQLERLKAFVDDRSDTLLGVMNTHHWQMVINDFYMSTDKVRVLAHFPAAPVHNLDARPPKLVGRQEDCGNLLRILSEDDAPVILASGYGGIGKSTLALEVAHRCLSLGGSYFAYIVWVDLRQYNTSHTTTLDSLLNVVARVMDPTGAIQSVTELEEKKHRVKQLMAKYRCLLLLDNYESVLEIPGQDHEITAFVGTLPVGTSDGGCVRVLFTTRMVSPGLQRLKSKVQVVNVQVPELNARESVEMMKLFSGTNSFPLDENECFRVAELMYGRPKYIQVAMDQLRVIPFAEWVRSVDNVPQELSQDLFFGNLFDLTWNRILGSDAKQLLMSMTYFVGSATFDALRTVTGLAHGRFTRAVEEASAAHLERRDSDRYGVHPLTHHACGAFLRRPENAAFHKAAGPRFAEYFIRLAEEWHRTGNIDTLERELGNVVAAAELAGSLELWGFVAQLRPAISGFLRIRGFWEDEKLICELARRASISIGDQAGLARCLVDDLAWLYLRLEELDKAESCAREGLGYFEALGDKAGIAQAWRQLGKASVLRAEYDDSKDGGIRSERHFAECDEWYRKSSGLWEEIEKESVGPHEKIGDMKLDFGRLYWLRGRKREHSERAKPDRDANRLDESYALYVEAERVSGDALALFLEMGNGRGTAKAFGNLGNAAKERARFLRSSKEEESADRAIAEAVAHYMGSLKHAEEIKRKDEIAHAAWGLAEAFEFQSLRSGVARDAKDKLLKQACAHARIAHELYASLGGPFDQRTTRALMERLTGQVEEGER